MLKALCLLMTAAAAFGEEDPWAKLRGLESGSELRIYKIGAKQPINARLDEVKQESILIATDKEQMAVPKSEIERVDRRIAPATSRVAVEARRVVGTHESTVSAAGADRSAPPLSTLAGIKIKSQQDFEIVYQRGPAADKK